MHNTSSHPLYTGIRPLSYTINHNDDFHQVGNLSDKNLEKTTMFLLEH